MGAYKKLILALLAMVVVVLITRAINLSSRNDIVYKIYKLDKDEPFRLLYSLVGKIPTSYQAKFIEKVVASSDKVDAIELTDTLCPFGYNYLYLHFSQTGHEGFIYAPPHFRLKENGSLSEENYVSGLVDTSLFQEYIKTKGEINRDSALNILTGFIGKALSNNVFVEITSRDDVNGLLTKYPLKSTSFEPTIDIYGVDYKFSDRKRYFWFNGCGLLEIQVKENYHFIVKMVGLIGNESIIM